MPTLAKCFAKPHVGSSLHCPFSVQSDVDKWLESGQKREESIQKLQEESMPWLTSYSTCIWVDYLLFTRAALYASCYHFPCMWPWMISVLLVAQSVMLATAQPEHSSVVNWFTWVGSKSTDSSPFPCSIKLPLPSLYPWRHSFYKIYQAVCTPGHMPVLGEEPGNEATLNVCISISTQAHRTKEVSEVVLMCFASYAGHHKWPLWLWFWH